MTLPLFESTFEPRTIVVDPPMTDAELEAFCLRSERVQIERTSEGVIHMHAPTGASLAMGTPKFCDSLPIGGLVTSAVEFLTRTRDSFCRMGLCSVRMLLMFCQSS